MTALNLNLASLASMIDLSAVQANSTIKDVRNFVGMAIKYNCKAVFALSSFLTELQKYRSESSGQFLVGGTVGFPSGGMTTAMKVQEAKMVLDLGVHEIDMMLNVGYLLSGMNQAVLDDIRAVKDVIGSIPLKVILECHYLTDDLISRAAEMAVEAGAQWVKTGTGWAPTGATLENIALLKKTVGDSIKIKASGGVKDLETLQKMVGLGAERFGLGMRAQGIINELTNSQQALPYDRVGNNQ